MGACQVLDVDSISATRTEMNEHSLKKTHKILLLAVEKGYVCDINGNVFSKSGKKLRLYHSSGGPIEKRYLMFSIRLPSDLHYKEISRAVPVHRLQAYQKFKDKIFEDDIYVRHLNGNSQDNSWTNVSIGTSQDNSLDRTEDARLQHSILAATKLRRFSDEEIKTIRSFYNSCKSYKQTMKEFGVSSKGSLHFMLNSKYKTQV